MKKLRINQVKLTKNECILKVYLIRENGTPGHYHALKFNSFEDCMAAQQRLGVSRILTIKDCLTGHTWQYNQGVKSYLGEYR